MKTFLYFLWQALLLIILARYRYVGPGLRTAMYTALIILLIIFLASQTYLLIQAKRESTGKPPLAIQNPVVNFFLTAGIPARNLKEARIAFWVILAAAVFFSVIYYPPFAAIF